MTWSEDPAQLREAVEGINPALAQRFGKKAKTFSFDNYFHDDEVTDWLWRTCEFDEIFQGNFFLYLPKAWAEIRQRKNAANVLEGQMIRQSLLILDKEHWLQSLPEFLEESRIEGFAYYPLFKPDYDQWLICTRDETTDKDWLYGFYCAGDWVFITKADAKGNDVLETQLISLLNSNPWYGWLNHAKEQALGSAPQ